MDDGLLLLRSHHILMGIKIAYDLNADLSAILINDTNRRLVQIPVQGNGDPAVFHNGDVLAGRSPFIGVNMVVSHSLQASKNILLRDFVAHFAGSIVGSSGMVHL
ncbi:hypothetical protein D3C77_616680 [compost metagenome]